MRLFVAALLPPAAGEDLEEFLEPRRHTVGAPRWSDPSQWHLTLSFIGAVPDRRLDGLVERLGARSSRWPALDLQVRGGGAFPHVGSAKVLYAGLHVVPSGSSAAPAGSERDAAPGPLAVPAARPGSASGPDPAGGHEPGGLAYLARSVRNACSAAGAEPDGARFRPHVTLGRFRPPVEATRWVRLLDTYGGPVFPVTAVALVESHLGGGAGGHARHDVLETFPLGPPLGSA